MSLQNQGAAAAHQRYKELPLQTHAMKLGLVFSEAVTWAVKSSSIYCNPAFLGVVKCTTSVHVVIAEARKWAAYFAWNDAPLDRTLEEARFKTKLPESEHATNFIKFHLYSYAC